MMSDQNSYTESALPARIVQVGRQPILDRHQRIYGYELLYRSEDATTNAGFDGDLATARTLLISFLEFGLQRLVGSHRIFINLTRVFFTDLQPLPIDKKRVVFEVLEDIEITQEVVEGVKKLHNDGYVIALDDYQFESHWDPLLPYCSIVKVDILDLDLDAYKQQISSLKARGLLLLAEKVETHEQHTHAERLGFDLFQGYFFAKPQTITTPHLPSNKKLLLKMISRINDPDADVEEIASLVELDPAISVKILRFVNSAAINLPRKVNSIHEAVVYVGIQRLRSWSTLLVMASMDHFSPELITTGLVRAELCKLLAEELEIGQPDSGYTVGLLSTLDAMVSQPMDELLDDLSLPKPLTDALVNHSGPYGAGLQCAIDLEGYQWLTEATKSISTERLNRMYVDALVRVENLRSEFT